MQSKAVPFEEAQDRTAWFDRNRSNAPLLMSLLFWFAFDGLLSSRIEASLMMLSAKLTALYRSSELYWEDAGYWVLPLADFDLRITEACSGASFLAMLCTLSLWLFLQRDRADQKFPQLFLAFLFALLFTLALNAIRIHLAGESFTLLQHHLSEGWQVRSHLLLGIFLFLPGLTAWFLTLTHLWKTHE